ncbi:MAG: phosphonate metabolism protein/1,5-bisphosphokinase (PRPP-forming) PhnN [Pseudomonadota bacterium]
MSGRVIAVVGPSGVGKDSVMAGLAATLPKAHLVQRVITRAKEAGGEPYHPVTDQEFDKLVARGAFCIHWRAHGLAYGIPRDLYDELALGKVCLVNFSRTALEKAARLFPNFVILNITAAPGTLAQRLSARARESEDEIARRLEKAVKTLPSHGDIRHVSNDGPLAETVARAAQILAMPGPQRPLLGQTPCDAHAGKGTNP